MSHPPQQGFLRLPRAFPGSLLLLPAPARPARQVRAPRDRRRPAAPWHPAPGRDARARRAGMRLRAAWRHKTSLVCVRGWSELASKRGALRGASLTIVLAIVRCSAGPELGSREWREVGD